MHRTFRLTFLFLSVALSGILLSCQSSIPPQTRFIMGTVCTINLYEQGTENLYTTAFERLGELESILSANRTDTNVADINRYAGIKPVKAHSDTLAVLNRALFFAEKTNGLFDPTIGPLVSLWNIGTDEAAVPASDELQTAVKLINWRNIEINTSENTIFLLQPGMRLDLGGIAKGYAADQLVHLFQGSGVKRAIINLGGNVYAYGKKKNNNPWLVGIRNPEYDGEGEIVALSVTDKTVVTSGINERFFEKDGKRYHHILDPRTGYPVENNLLSVTIISTSSIDADALSTACFLLGVEKGIELLETLENTDALFITTEKKIITSRNIQGDFSIRNQDFTQ